LSSPDLAHLMASTQQHGSPGFLLTGLKEKLIKIGAKIVSHGRYVALRMARRKLIVFIH